VIANCGHMADHWQSPSPPPPPPRPPCSRLLPPPPPPDTHRPASVATWPRAPATRHIRKVRAPVPVGVHLGPETQVTTVFRYYHSPVIQICLHSSSIAQNSLRNYSKPLSNAGDTFQESGAFCESALYELNIVWD
jgi:hypothetical protein